MSDRCGGLLQRLPLGAELVRLGQLRLILEGVAQSAAIGFLVATLSRSRHATGWRARILIVDDDPSVRATMVQLLPGWGCRCRAIEGSGEAVSFPEGERVPDLLICDYRLRDALTGADVIARLRRHWRQPIPALLVTSDTAQARLREAWDSGVPLIPKPAPPNILRQVLRMLIL